jgi:hypothetical protein
LNIFGFRFSSSMVCMHKGKLFFFFYFLIWFNEIIKFQQQEKKKCPLNAKKEKEDFVEVFILFLFPFFVQHAARHWLTMTTEFGFNEASPFFFLFKKCPLFSCWLLNVMKSLWKYFN